MEIGKQKQPSWKMQTNELHLSAPNNELIVTCYLGR